MDDRSERARAWLEQAVNDALPEHGIPAKAFGKDQARQALALAENVVRRIEEEMAL